MIFSHLIDYEGINVVFRQKYAYLKHRKYIVKQTGSLFLVPNT